MGTVQESMVRLPGQSESDKNWSGWWEILSGWIRTCSKSVSFGKDVAGAAAEGMGSESSGDESLFLLKNLENMLRCYGARG